MVSDVLPLRSRNNPNADCFDTDAVASKDRFSYWNETICAFLSPVDSVQLARDRPFSAKLQRINAGPLQVSDIRFSPMRNNRTRDLLRSRPNENFFVALMVAGHGRLVQDQRCATPGPGDVVIYDSARPFTWAFDHDSRMLIGQLPRRLLTSRIPASDQIAARTLRCGEPCASLVASVLNETIRLDAAPDETALQRLGASLADTLAAALEFGLTQGKHSLGHQDLLDRAKAVLLRHIEDPDFDFSRLVSELGVSGRTLCRVFAADGTTAIRWLWRQRLEHAHRLLDERRVSTVSQAAMRSGFNDLSHFTRAFKTRYGEMPRSILRERAQ
jgi:AraC-like DNA-binding protein